MIPGIALSLIALSGFMVEVKGHGRLIEPPSRASMWRYGFSTPDHFPRKIIIIARRIQQIVTCYDIFSSQKHFKVGQVFASPLSGHFCQMALG